MATASCSSKPSSQCSRALRMRLSAAPSLPLLLRRGLRCPGSSPPAAPAGRNPKVHFAPSLLQGGQGANLGSSLRSTPLDHQVPRENSPLDPTQLRPDGLTCDCSSLLGSGCMLGTNIATAELSEGGPCKASSHYPLRAAVVAAAAHGRARRTTCRRQEVRSLPLRSSLPRSISPPRPRRAAPVLWRLAERLPYRYM